jgi:UV DNA damage repair endonuclease
MSHAHNVLIRGLNSIYQQGAFVWNPQDISDFLFFCSAWVKTVEHHHKAEEKTMFPELEKFTNNPDIMAENKQQHDAFLKGLTDFEHYAESTTPETFRWNEAKAKLDAFTPALITHLRDEIATLLSLKQYDSAKLRAVWDVTENAAKGDIRLPNMFVSCIGHIPQHSLTGL